MLNDSCALSFQAKSQFKRRSTANNVEIIIPVPTDADTPKFKTTVGSCKYAPDLNSVIWTIKSFPVSKDLPEYMIYILYDIKVSSIKLLFFLLPILTSHVHKGHKIILKTWLDSC